MSIQKQIKDLKEKHDKELYKLLAQLSKEERIKLGYPSLNPTEKAGGFTANGQKYVIRHSLTISRYEEFEKLQIRVGYGVDFAVLFGNMRKVYDLMNGGKIADAAVTLYNTMENVAQHMDGRENEVLLLCTLFICRPDEDTAIYDEALAKEKIEDWKLEGIDIKFFFRLAFSLVNGLSEIYDGVLQNISIVKAET